MSTVREFPATLSLLCKLQQDRPHKPCSGTTDDGTESPCRCSCHLPERYLPTIAPSGDTTGAADAAAISAGLAFLSTRPGTQLEISALVRVRPCWRCRWHLRWPPGRRHWNCSKPPLKFIDADTTAIGDPRD